jgi:salicylate hydroxylase
MGRRNGGRRYNHDDNDHDRYLDPATAHICIIGAGLTGLATARQLETHGFSNITIYERDASLQARSEGYGLTLQYQPGGVLDTLGILDDVADAECPSRSHYLLDAMTGAVRGYFGNAFGDLTTNYYAALRRSTASTTTDTTGSLSQSSSSCSLGYGQRGNLRVPRQRVRQILVDKLQTTVICWNHQLVGLHQVVNDKCEDKCDSRMQLHFGNGQSAMAHVVIAADGIRSTVVQHYLPCAPPPQSLRVRIILGLTRHDDEAHDSTEAFHGLLHERGFYTLAPHHRLFVMPYTGSALQRSLDPHEPVRFMWQLSFDDCLDNDDDSVCSKDGAALLALARARTRDWHAPVADLLRSTPVESVWGCLLHDRDPVVLHQHWQKQVQLLQQQKQHGDTHGTAQSSWPPPPPRVLIAGDALHAMSPFKGQGANQCLRGGIVVAKWLAATIATPPIATSAGATSSGSTSNGTTTSSHKADKSSRSKRPLSLASAVTSAMREMVQRTAPIVAASRRAAAYWHGPTAAHFATRYTFAGLCSIPDCDQPIKDHVTEDKKDQALVDALLGELQRRSVTAGATPNLDEAIRSVLVELLGLSTWPPQPSNEPCATTASVDAAFAQQALRAAWLGQTSVLRQLSWQSPNWIRLIAAVIVDDSAQPPSTNAAVKGEMAMAAVESTRKSLAETTATVTTCLHLAAAAGHASTVHWLVTEAGCSLRAHDGLGRSVLQVAVFHPDVTSLLEQLQQSGL